MQGTFRRENALNYTCTRDRGITVTAARAIVQGISKDGGLFVPERLPAYTPEDLQAMQGMDYVGRACKILSDFLPGFSADEIRECVSAAYAPRKIFRRASRAGCGSEKWRVSHACAGAVARADLRV